MNLELTREQAGIVIDILEFYQKKYLSEFSWDYQQVETILSRLEKRLEEDTMKQEEAGEK